MTSSWLNVWVPTRETESKLRPSLTPQNSVTTTINSETGLNFHITRVNSKEHAEEESPSKKLEIISENETLDVPKPDFQRSQSSEASIPEKFVERSTLEDSLMEVLKILKVKHYLRQRTEDDEYIMISFCILSQHVEIALISLQNHGIGNNEHTAVSVVNNAIHLRGNLVY